MYWQSVAGIGSYWLEQLPMAQKAIQMHEPQHPLVINRIAAMLELCSYPSIALAGKFQSDILNFVSDNCIFGILRYICLLLYSPFAVAAATYIQYLAGLGYGQLKTARMSFLDRHVLPLSVGFSLSSRTFFWVIANAFFKSSFSA